MTATISSKKETIFGNKRIVEFDVALGAYATGGISVTPADLGLRNIDLMLIETGSDGYVYEYDYSAKKIKAMVAGGDFSITVSAPAVAVSGAAVHISGPTGAGIALQLTNVTATGKISKTEATNRAIPLITFGVPAHTAALATAPTFPATTVQGGLAELATGTLSTATHCIAIGD